MKLWSYLISIPNILNKVFNMKIVWSLVITSLLLGASIDTLNNNKQSHNFTLKNLSHLQLDVVSDVEFIKEKQKVILKKVLKARLENAGFTFDKADAATFFLSIGASDAEVIYIQVGIRENVTTLREKSVQTPSFTYLSHDFIEADNAYFDTIESVHLLLDTFVITHQENNL